MLSSLTKTIDAYTSLHSGDDLYYETPVEGLSFMRAEAPVGPLYSIHDTCLCFVVQGAKESTIDGTSLTYAEGDGLVVEVDAPAVSHVTRATGAAPFLGLKLSLKADLLAEVAKEVELPNEEPDRNGVGARVVEVDPHTEEALTRLVELVQTPRAISALYAPRLQEVYYWLLSGSPGPALLRLVLPGGQMRQIIRAIRRMKEAFPEPVRVEELAEAAGMSPSSFHTHFKDVTGTSPIQYYKRLRLLEARRLMTANGATTAQAVAFEVGYESPSHFSRDYARAFGVPPGRDAGRTTAD